MTLFDSADAQSLFVQTQWQKAHAYLPQALNTADFKVLPQTLRSLASKDEIESRYIQGFAMDEPWYCDYGPFESTHTFTNTEFPWTLLIQGLEQHCEPARTLLTLFNFLPRWRLEDIMASLASKDGSVGAHFDYYDVFLVQIAGHRDWRLGQWCNEQTTLKTDSDVKLLESFEQTDQIHTAPGDILYIPAGLAHWGIAQDDDCITLSVGFRSPSANELAHETFAILADEFNPHTHYQDSVAAIDRDPYRINLIAHENIAQWFKQITPEKIAYAAQQAFGQLVTEHRHPVPETDHQPNNGHEIRHVLSSGKALKLTAQPYHRLAYSENTLFINGDSYSVRTVLAQECCHGKITVTLSQDERELIEQWCNEYGFSISPYV